MRRVARRSSSPAPPSPMARLHPLHGVAARRVPGQAEHRPGGRRQHQVRGPARRPAELDQRFRDPVPAVRRRPAHGPASRPPRGRRASPPAPPARPRTRPCRRAARRSRARRGDAVDQHVAGGADGRQPGPQVVENPGAEGELGLQTRAVGEHRDVGLGEPAGPLVVRHPAVHQVHDGSDQAQLGGPLPRPPARSASARPARGARCRGTPAAAGPRRPRPPAAADGTDSSTSSGSNHS